jgi:hypothetical protein
MFHTAPAEKTTLVATKSGSHLNATPAFNSVKLVFVALITATQ